MPKAKKLVYYCTECGFESSKWMGQCPGCRQWNTFAEEPVPVKQPAVGGSRSAERAVPKTLREIPAAAEERVSTGIVELDRVLGGGIVGGSLILVGGDPGIGKSTLLLQVCRNLALDGRQVLYISGEESLRQIRLRADRLGEFRDSLRFLCETDLGEVRQVLETIKPQIAVIDSIQTMYDQEVGAAPGSVSQVREATNVFLQLAKGLGITVFLVGHVTKEGNVAGPRVLEHMVDTVLYFEGDRFASYRILRAVKNRFGSTNEIGVFEMKDTGLDEVRNPSEYMLEGKPTGSSGSVVTCAMEGTRPLLVEVQALVCRSSFGLPRRTAVGADYGRVNMLLAVLEKKARLSLSDYDAYVNVTGGIRMNEPAIDLGIILAVFSSYRDRVIPDSVVAFGEVGLSGEVRSVSMAAQRVQEAKKLGFTTVVLPAVCKRSVKKPDGMQMIYVSWLNEAIAYFSQG
ncbi:MAG: DNA repair protein RadA [Blautia sp.]|nr:DNA repair protein RadA [Blautia sp.]